MNFNLNPPYEPVAQGQLLSSKKLPSKKLTKKNKARKRIGRDELDKDAHLHTKGFNKQKGFKNRLRDQRHKKTFIPSDNGWNECKPVASSKTNPHWIVETLDLTRDRKVKQRKKGKGRLKFGSAHQYSQDQKFSRLDLQSGESDSLESLTSLM